LSLSIGKKHELKFPKSECSQNRRAAKKKLRETAKNPKSLPRVGKLEPNSPFALRLLIKPLCP